MTQTASGMELIRNALLDTLKGIQAGTITPETAKAVNALCQTGINAAKVEVDYLHLNKNANTAFFNSMELAAIEQKPAPKTTDAPKLSILKEGNRTITQDGNVTTVKVR